MKSILVIEDDVHYRTVLRLILERAGYRVLLAPDGREGLEQWSRERADMVIVDIFMPEKDGLETISEIRRNSPDAKIIAISGGGYNGQMDFLDVARSLGADLTMHKPFAPAEMLDSIKLCVGA